MRSIFIYGRVIAVLAVIFIAVQVYLSSYNQETGNGGLSDTGFKILKIYRTLSNALDSATKTDRSGQYKIIPVSRAAHNKSSFDVTFVSQCSWNRFNYIESLLEEWQGPVSVAVFSDVEFIHEVLWRLSVAVYCHRMTALYLTLVVPVLDTYPKNPDYGIDMSKRFNGTEFCKPPYSIDLKNVRNYNWYTPYPVNLLRNVAKSRTNTEFILTADIDMIPNKDLRKDFLRYVWSRKLYSKKVVFVVPSFEMNFGIKTPRTKYEIILEVQKGNMRPFYILPCRKCQSLTNYTRWFSYPNQHGTRVLYKIDWKHPWEPFFVSYRNAPDFDERFKQYGYNRVSQACQLHMEGYSFLILDNVFLIHRGFKSVTDFHKTKDLEMNSNRKLYNKFKIEMKMRHQNSSRHCEG